MEIEFSESRVSNLIFEISFEYYRRHSDRFPGTCIRIITDVNRQNFIPPLHVFGK